MKGFSLAVDGLKIRGNVFGQLNNTNHKPTILFIHGWESKQDRHFVLAETLAQIGYTCVTFDMRGHGMSDGDHTLCSREDFLKDAVSVYDFLTSKTYTSQVVVIGASFGAYLAALLCAKRKVHALGLRVPADYRDDGFNEPLYAQRNEPSHTTWKAQLHSPTETASLRAINSFSGEVLVVESERDELVPASTVLSYKQAVTDPERLTYVVMKNAPHSISHHQGLQQEFVEIVSKWLRKL